MKKSILFLAAVSALMVSVSCSNDEVEGAQAPDNDTFISAPVEIRLGALASVTTRAALDDIDDIEDGELGVFCLARAKHDDAGSSVPAPSWFNNSFDANYKNYMCIIKNDAASIGTGGAITLSTTYFYPYIQAYKYDFYAYYPRKANPSTSEGKVCVDYVLDGKTDIVCGRATNNAEYAYSAKYFRYNTDQPVVTLNHKLTRLRFFIEPAEDTPGSNTYVDATNLTVTSLKVKQAVKNVTLTIADQASASSLTYTGSEPVKDDMILYDSNGSTFTPKTVSNDGSSTQLGESLLLYPASTYQIEFTVKKAGESDVVNTITSDIKISNTKSFEAGKVYDITLVLKGPNAVSVKSVLTPWGTYIPEDSEEEQNLNPTFNVGTN